MPRSITVHVGDSVRFVDHGFHTIDIPSRGAGALGLFQTSGIVSGANDAAGQPFWFNGQSGFAFDPLLFKSLFGKTVKYTGKSRLESGLPLGPPKPVTVRFTKTGTYTLLCDVHPGMKGVVHVVAKSKKVPSAKADRKALRNQVATALHLAKGLLKTSAPPNTIKIGAHAAGGVESLTFFPSNTSVPVGTTVLFQMPTSSLEVHTATTGPGNAEDAKTYVGALAASFNSPAPSAQAIYPSEAPTTLANLTPTLHGNGFWNSGLLDVSTTTPLPDRNAVKFTQLGTYTFYCLIHPFMKVTVTVK
jgi:plastocyanin